MQTEEIRHRVVALFSANRAHPSEAFNEDHFIDFFIRNPTGKKWATQGSCTGLRRRNRFFRQIEREFSVCLGNKDFDRSFSLANFVERIAELRSSPRSSRAALKARRRAGAGWGAVVVIDFVLLSVAMWLRDFWWLSALPLAAFVVFTCWVSEGLIADSIHNRALSRLLESDHRSEDRVRRKDRKTAQPGATDNPDGAVSFPLDHQPLFAGPDEEMMIALVSPFRPKRALVIRDDGFPFVIDQREKTANQALQTTSVTRSGFGKVSDSDRQRRGV